MRKRLALLLGLAVLVIVNAAIYQRERLLTHGSIALLELAPVDPRSFMQGDYMALRFALADAVFSGQHEDALADGRLVLRLDEHRVAAFVRFDDGRTPLEADEIRLRYRLRRGKPKFATNAFFFQEGTADAYATARYGEFRVDTEGDALLTALRDASRTVLMGEAKTIAP
jgi:uncharacterized membrane-anchored protein